MKSLVYAGIWFTLAASAPAQFGFGPATGGPRPVRVQLVSETTAIVPGQPFHVALEMTHDAGWHSYWTNPGTGMPTEMTWDLPEGFEIGDKISPIPEFKEDVIGNLHYYHDTIFHVYPVTPPANLAGASVTLKGTASWLQCIEDRCDPPQQAKVEISLPVAEETAPNEDVAPAIQAVLDQQPQSLDAWSVTSTQTPETITFTLTPGEGADADPGEIYIFEEDQSLDAETPERRHEGDQILLTLPKDDEAELSELNGYFYAPNGWLADGSVPTLTLTLASDRAAAEEDPESPAAGATNAGDGGGPDYVTLSGEEEIPLSLWKALLFGLLGGMILNLMPCVFPVISIKILGFVDQAGEDSRKVKMHGLVFGAGVLISIWILAAILLGVREATGQQTGWGSHLGNPIVTGVIVILMFVLALNLAGLFEFGTSLMGVGGNLMRKKGFAGSFFSGVLTTVVATPCSGPFLGAVMGFTFAQPMAIAFLLFTFFALGVALPYMILSFFPQLVSKLPPPGGWMETFKHIMAFPMFAAALFFLNAFGGVVGVSGVVWMLLGLLVLGAALWVYGHWCPPSCPPKARRWGGLAALLLALFGFFLSYEAAQFRDDKGASNAGGLVWEEWSPKRVRDLREEGRMLFVDFTADW